MRQADEARARFESGFECSQAVFSTFAPELGLDRGTALRVASAFGAGMARAGRTCGAVTGALMVIGLKHGKAAPDDEESKERTYRLADAFVERFAAREGSVLCRQLLGYEIKTPEGRQQARQAGRFETLCPRLVHDAAEILEEILGAGTNL